jgi:hypothetical protein
MGRHHASSRPIAVKPSCRIVSSEYLDRDVYLNVRGFYAAAGFHLLERSPVPELLVVLRGDNGSAWSDFRGQIHVYDYVKEYRVDWPARYPHAASIQLISLENPGPIAEDPRLRWVRGYLPVLPALWSRPAQRRRQRPVHLSNYKRMAGDPFQEQLLGLIRAGLVEVFGGRWQLVGVSSTPLSYRQANRLIARSASCFGLMWPYQRGRTLSGRMWQAPLNGCFVFSEPGSDPLGCPGVIRAERFDAATAGRRFSPESCSALAVEADHFWRQHSAALAAELGLDPHAAEPAGWQLFRLRLLLLLWDLEFQGQQLLGRLGAMLAPPVAALRRRLAAGARALGVHPQQRRERRRPHQ